MKKFGRFLPNSICVNSSRYIRIKNKIPVNGLIGDLLEDVENALLIVLLEVVKDEEKLLSAPLKAVFVDVFIPLFDS